MRLPGDDGVSDPDRKVFFTDTHPVTLRDQLNENWRQTRLIGRAITDRDQMIADMRDSIQKLRDVNTALQKRLKLASRIWPLIYAAVGGVGAQLAKLAVDYGVHRLAK